MKFRGAITSGPRFPGGYSHETLMAVVKCLWNKAGLFFIFKCLFNSLNESVCSTYDFFKNCNQKKRLKGQHGFCNKSFEQICGARFSHVVPVNVTAAEALRGFSIFSCRAVFVAEALRGFCIFLCGPTQRNFSYWYGFLFWCNMKYSAVKTI